MPRLVAGGPGKRKVWHAWVNDCELTVRFGPMGKTQQEQTKSFDSPEKAKAELAKLVKQKLAKGYADAAWTFEFDSGLRCREIVDLPLPVPPAVLSEAGAWRETFWHGDHAMALERCGADRYRAAVLDRATGAMRLVEPAIEGSSFPYGFDDARDRFIVATPTGAAWVVDCKSARAEEVAPAGAEVLAVALGRDYFAVLRRGTLEITSRGAKHVVACGRQNKLFGFGGGLGLMLTWKKENDSWDGKSWPGTFFLGIDGSAAGGTSQTRMADCAIRLLGAFGLEHAYGYDLDGESYFKNDATGLIAIENLAQALAKTAGAPAPEKLPPDSKDHLT